MIVVLMTTQKIRYFCEDYDYDHNSNKEDCDHGRSHIKTQKHDIFVRIVTMTKTQK